MRMLILATLRLVLRLRVRIRNLVEEDIDVAAQLLTEQFCTREPLCRNLHMQGSELLPFFKAELAHVAREGMGLVAVSRRGRIIGAMTAEDEFAPFIRQQSMPALDLIGGLLGLMRLPAEYQPQKKGEAYSVGIAAVDSEHAGRFVLTALTIANFDRLYALGYKRGFAKITSPRMMARLQGFERILHQTIFTVLGTVSAEADGAFAPLAPAQITLVTWTMPFLKKGFLPKDGPELNHSRNKKASISFAY